MKVIQGENVDLLSPFPKSQVDRIYGWIRSFKNIIEFDGWLKGRQEFKKHYSSVVIPNIPTYGIIDKHNKALQDVEIPLVGFISVEDSLPTNSYLQICSNLRAFKAGLLEEALELVKKEVFSNEAKLRISAWVLRSNREAYKFFRDNGFEKEGIIDRMVTQNGKPKSVWHMGCLR